ncbi:hypothetical protein OA067_04225 [Gammaproteobacteria bacterium]|nr:hypothetical protein [Gammaproteobacteria bacterium]
MDSYQQMDVYVVRNAGYHDTNFAGLELLGSRFIAHPANQGIKIRLTDVKHSLTFVIEDFEVEDEEPHYCEPLGEQFGLLEASLTNLRWDMLVQITQSTEKVTRKYMWQIWDQDPCFTSPWDDAQTNMI